MPTTHIDRLLRLLAWLSPAFPVGGFSYSHGLEAAIDKGLLTDAAGVEGWIASILRHGAGWTDSLLFLAAHRAVGSVESLPSPLAGGARRKREGEGASAPVGPTPSPHRRRSNAPLARSDRTSGGRPGGVDPLPRGERGLSPQLPAIVDLAAAWRATAETAIESRAQGQAFLAALRSAWPDPGVAPFIDALGPAPAYAVAVAVAASAAGIDEESALAAFLQALGANLVSAAVRLVPLGQTDGQRVLAGLVARLPAIVGRARQATLEDLGTATAMVDWTSAQHETQYTRLFRS
jgi:urease accessory protein